MSGHGTRSSSRSSRVPRRRIQQRHHAGANVAVVGAVEAEQVVDRYQERRQHCSGRWERATTPEVSSSGDGQDVVAGFSIDLNYSHLQEQM